MVEENNIGERQGSRDGEALSVSAAMNLAKGALESFTVTIVGEVSEASIKPGYKAAYFTIKDTGASLPCLMWNNRYKASGVKLAVGQLVQVTGRFSLYAAKGRMNFEAFSLSLAGEGNLRLQVANLARKLQAEGLMDPARKKPVPRYPQKIGVVTSPRGAAVHDVLRTLRRRFPVAQVVFAGVPVEGPSAPSHIIDGIKCVYDAGAEVILVVRGGGSFEDLMPFNDERLARTIAKCPTPVVTGIGHEPDTSIADMVADLRASTPTAAAESVSPSRESLESLFEKQAETMANNVERRISMEKSHLDSVGSRPLFADSMYLLGQGFQAVDLRANRLLHALPTGVSKDTVALEGLEGRLLKAIPAQIKAKQERIDGLENRIKLESGRVNVRFENELSLAASRLDDLSPLKTIARGYAIARSEDGTIVSSVEQVSAGDSLSVAVRNGTIGCTVDSCTIENRQ